MFLYLLPAHAEARYAWAVAPPINAAFMGAGYLAGTVATALVVFATRSGARCGASAAARRARVGLLAATLIHADRFRWDYPLTWVWTGVYAAVPLVVGTSGSARSAGRPPRRRPTRGCAACGSSPP